MTGRSLGMPRVDGARRPRRPRDGARAASRGRDRLARLGEVRGRVHVDERAQLGVDRAKRLDGHLDDVDAAGRSRRAGGGRTRAPRARRAGSLDAVEREQRLGALLGDRDDDVARRRAASHSARTTSGSSYGMSAATASTHSSSACGQRGDEPAERTLVGDLVGDDAHVGGKAGLGERLGPVGDDDGVRADLADGLDDARDERLAVDGQQRLVDAHAHASGRPRARRR